MMGFFNDLGDLFDPLGITDFDGDGTHDFVESMASIDIANSILNDSADYNDAIEDNAIIYDKDDSLDIDDYDDLDEDDSDY